MLSRFHPGDGKPGSQWAHHPKVVNGLLFRGLRPGRACPLPTHRTAPRPLGRCTSLYDQVWGPAAQDLAGVVHSGKP